MKTAVEFYVQEFNKGNTYSITSNPEPDLDAPFYSEIFDLMIEFAKLHVQKALEQACDEAQIVWENRGYESTPNGICKLSIMEAYPLSNIK